jgi:hypothetical protein
MAASPGVRPPDKPEALVIFLPAKIPLAGNSAVPLRPSRFIKVRRPKRSFEVFIVVSGCVTSALFDAEPKRTDTSSIYF